VPRAAPVAGNERCYASVNKRRVFQRRVLHATRCKSESKYRPRGAGGPDKIKQLFPRFIESAVNRRPSPCRPYAPKYILLGRVSTRARNSRDGDPRE